MKTAIITDTTTLESIAIRLNTRGAYRLLREHIEAMTAQAHNFLVRFLDIDDKTDDPTEDPL